MSSIFVVINIAILVILNFNYEVISSNSFSSSRQNCNFRILLKGLLVRVKIILKRCWPIYLLVSTVIRCSRTAETRQIFEIEVLSSRRIKISTCKQEIVRGRAIVPETLWNRGSRYCRRKERRRWNGKYETIKDDDRSKRSGERKSTETEIPREMEKSRKISWLRTLAENCELQKGRETAETGSSGWPRRKNPAALRGLRNGAEKSSARCERNGCGRRN